jgi:regulator of sigma E protease
MSFLSWVLYIAIAILVLMIMITVHEFGHFTAGKLLKFKINEFSIGFGKALFQKNMKDGTKFAIRLVPLGGYCAFDGEDEEGEKEGSFNSQPVWKRLIVLFMGPFFNFLSALLVSIIFLMCFGYADNVVVAKVTAPVSISAEAWLVEGDRITAVNGTKTDFVYDNYFQTLITDFDYNEDFTITVERNGKYKDIVVSKKVWNEVTSQKDETYSKKYSLDGENYNYVVKYNAEQGKYQLLKLDANGNPSATFDAEANPDGGYLVKETDLGKTFLIEITSEQAGDSSDLTLKTAIIGISTENYKYGFFEALGGTFVFCFKWAWKILIILWQLITCQLAISNIGGTVTTVVTMAQVAHANMANLLLLFPLISINLAVFNLLPFPALDGARMVFVGIEGVRGKPINRKIEANIHFFGLVILLAFVLIVDILHFVL